ncbi:MAG: PAS domain S-box protein [Balneolaceae bacterium]|nr:PAS domain S-box protein [Balneolaceae bacterium]
MIYTILQSEEVKPVQEKILRAFSAHMAIIDAEGIILKTNESWQENQGGANALFHGRQAGDNYFDFCKQQIMEGSGHALEELLGLYSVLNGEKEHFTIKYPHASSSGRVRWFKMKAISVDSQRSGLIIIHKEITDQVEQKKSLRENRERYEQQFTYSMDGILITSSTGCVIDGNPAASQILGYEPHQFKNLKREDFVVLSDPNYQEALEERESAGAYRAEFQMKRSDGSVLTVEANSRMYRTSSGEKQAILNFRDITERKHLEERIRQLLEQEKENHQEAEQKKTKLQEIFTNAPSAICVLEGPEHTYTFANEAYEQLVGKEQITGKTVKELLPEVESQGFIDLLDKVYSSGEPFYASEKPIMLNQNGDDSLKEVILNFVFKPMKENGKTEGIFVDAIDVTQQVNNRQQLSRSLKEKEVLIREIHHRVKNNLALISGMIELQLGEAATEHETCSLFATKSRIHTIAKIQELIYQNGDLSNIPFDQFIENFTRFTSSLHGTNATPTHTDLDLQPVYLNINQAVPFGLLINEIISKIERHNAEKKPQKIKIALRCSGDSIQLSFSYTNSALHAPPSFNDASSLNDTLIQTFCQQLNASLLCEKSDMHQQNISLSFIKSEKTGSASNLNK